MAMMTKSEFAAFMQVGPSAVSNWAKRGLIVMGPDPDRPGGEKVDADKSAILINATVDRSRGRPKNSDRSAAEALPDPENPIKPPALGGAPPKAVLSDIEQARLDDMRERVTTRRIENGQLIGTLVSIAEFERRAAEMGLLIRERSHALIREHAETLADETDPRVVQSFLSEKFDELFSKLADEIELDAAAEQSADRDLAAVEAELETLEAQAD